MKKHVMVAAVLGMVVFSAGQARAQASFGAQASFADDTDFGIGARVYVPLPFNGVRFVGSFNYFFPNPSSVDYYELNANAIYSIPVTNMPAFAPYAGGGLVFAHTSFSTSILGTEVSGSDSTLGLNALGGAEFGTGPIKPFAELRAEMRSGSQFVIAGGVRF